MYLVYLGVKKFRERPNSNEAQQVNPFSMQKVFAQGVMVNVLNPKTAILFFAFLSQFVSPGRGHVTLQFFSLGMLFAVMAWVSDSTWALVAGSVGR